MTPRKEIIGNAERSSMTLPELILTEADMAKNILARLCRENILRARRNRQAGQRRRKG